jgi:hypothetical protein
MVDNNCLSVRYNRRVDRISRERGNSLLLFKHKNPLEFLYVQLQAWTYSPSNRLFPQKSDLEKKTDQLQVSNSTYVQVYKLSPEPQQYLLEELLPIMSESSESLKFPSGDVTLLAKHTVTKAPLTYIVSSVALSLASPVWRKFLFPPWESADSERKSKQIDCTEDDSLALLILLNVAHLQFNKVPNGKLEYDLLFEVAKLCDQYDCMDLVRPWVAGWLEKKDGCLLRGHLVRRRCLKP